MSHDPVVGPVIACGAGGTQVEPLRDLAGRPPPLTDLDAHVMVAELALHPLLQGYRRYLGGNIGAREMLLHRVSRLALARLEIAELDGNPVVVGPDDAFAGDVRVRLDWPRAELRLSVRRPA